MIETRSALWDVPDPRPFAWRGRDAQGQPVSGERFAAGAASLRWSLAEAGIEVDEVRPVRRGWRFASWLNFQRGRQRVSRARDHVLFMRQLATLLRAGVPLLQALGVTETSQTGSDLRLVIAQLQQRLKGGQALSVAMQAYPRHFDVLTCRMIAAGELSGALDVMCDRAASYQERMLNLRDKVRTALFYPAMVLLMALFLTLALLLFVIPGFARLYADAGALLPWPTRVVLAISDGLMAYGPWILALLLVVGGVLGQFGSRWPALRVAMDRLVLHVPVLGGLVTRAALARWAGTFAALFAAGIPLRQTLEAAGGATGHTTYTETIAALQADVTAGQTVSVALARARVFPPMVVQMAAVGEESGSLDSLMAKVADYYEQEVAETIARLSNLVEPVLMVVLGLLIGGVVIAMYLPVFRMGSVL